jgi:hypothetical protein
MNGFQTVGRISAVPKKAKKTKTPAEADHEFLPGRAAVQRDNPAKPTGLGRRTTGAVSGSPQPRGLNMFTKSQAVGPGLYRHFRPGSIAYAATFGELPLALVYLAGNSVSAASPRQSRLLAVKSGNRAASRLCGGLHLRAVRRHARYRNLIIWAIVVRGICSNYIARRSDSSSTRLLALPGQPNST